MTSTTSLSRADAVRNRLRVMEAADLVFAEQGLDAPLSLVAQRAGVGVGTIYRGFGDKEALVASLVQRRLDRIAEICAQAQASATGWHGLELLLHRLAEHFAADVLFGELLNRSDDAGTRDRGRQLIVGALSDLVPRAHAEGAARAGLEVSDVLVVIGMIPPTIIPGAPEGQWRRYVTMLVDGISAGAQGRLQPAALTMAQVDELSRIDP